MYSSIDNLNHLKAYLDQKYKRTLNMTGELYCSLTLKWDYVIHYEY